MYSGLGSSVNVVRVIGVVDVVIVLGVASLVGVLSVKPFSRRS